MIYYEERPLSPNKIAECECLENSTLAKFEMIRQIIRESADEQGMIPAEIGVQLVRLNETLRRLIDHPTDPPSGDA